MRLKEIDRDGAAEWIRDDVSPRRQLRAGGTVTLPVLRLQSHLNATLMLKSLFVATDLLAQQCSARLIKLAATLTGHTV